MNKNAERKVLWVERGNYVESGGGALHHSSSRIPEMLPAVARAWKFSHMLRKGAVNFHEKKLRIGQWLFLLWTRLQNFLNSPRIRAGWVLSKQIMVLAISTWFQSTQNHSKPLVWPLTHYPIQNRFFYIYFRKSLFGTRILSICYK